VRRVALLLLLLLVYLPGLGSSASGTHPDEAWYLGISAEMHAKGEWLTPTIDDVPTWYKPPLFYWAERGAYALLGTGLLAARLPSALAFVALCLVVGALARRMYGERAELAAALLTATAFGWVRYARLAMMDAPMALGLAIAAYGTWRAAEEGRRRWLLAAGAGAAMDFLLKGPVGAVLVLLLSGGFLAVRAPRLLASRWTWLAVALGAALGLPWYVASFAVHGRAFYDFFVVTQNYDRFMHPWTLRGEATLLVGFLVFMLPWTFLFLGSLGSLRRWREPGILLPLAWMSSVLVTFTIPSLKWPHYALGAIPGAMLLVSRELPARAARIATGTVLLAAGIAAALLLRVPLPAPAPLAIAGAALAALAAGVLSLRGAVGAAAGACAAVYALVGLVLPAVNPPAIPPGAVAPAAERALWVYDTTPGLFTLDAGRPVRRAWTPAEAARALDGGGALILSDAQREALDPGLRARLAELSRWRRIPGYLPAARVWRAWRDRDPSILFEGMALVALPEAGAGAGQSRNPW
jgi:4-amino-4-deoxy-L-arabinose transferase-like glycosyltransferase